MKGREIWEMKDDENVYEDPISKALVVELRKLQIERLRRVEILITVTDDDGKTQQGE